MLVGQKWPRFRSFQKAVFAHGGVFFINAVRDCWKDHISFLTRVYRLLFRFTIVLSFLFRKPEIKEAVTLVRRKEMVAGYELSS